MSSALGNIIQHAAAANPLAPSHKKASRGARALHKTAGAQSAVDVSARSAERDREEVARINRERLVATAAQLIRSRINPDNPPLDPARLPRTGRSHDPLAAPCSGCYPGLQG